MTPEAYHSAQTAIHRNTLQRLNRHRNGITLLKLLTFAALVAQVVYLINHVSLPLLFPVATIAVFMILTILDTRLVRRRRLTEELIRTHEMEIAALHGDLSAFPRGEEHLDPSHPYAADLDLFGEASLYAHINRTVTPGGTARLVRWMLAPCRDKETLLHRRQAAEELAASPGLCLLFRAHGRLHPATQTDTEVLEAWQHATAFFRHPRTTRTLVYSSNILTLAAWAALLPGWLPFPIALTLSSLQLFVWACCLKKINRHHRRLDTLLHSLSPLLPLLTLLHCRASKAPLLQTIHGTLFAGKNNAGQAFTALHRIREQLDRRGNQLLAFLLNGLYLQDLHTLLRLDAWQTAYAPRLSAWTDAISETDALVSLALYRFHHPDYILPEVSGTTLLDARAAAHPLMTDRPCVPNDFRIDHPRQLYIVTGANMAGKSTFLRTIGTNLVLAQMGSVVRASRFTFRPMALFTSMRTTDNLAHGTSYFHAELLRLRQLIDMAQREEHTFVILDEMLKGTNSADKLNGSLAFLRKLLQYPVSGLVATHDLALGTLHDEHPDHFRNVCFEITHTPAGIHYDYRLHPGTTTTMNATILLKEMGLID